MSQFIKDLLGIKSKNKKEDKENIFNLPLKSISDIFLDVNGMYKILGRVSPINGELLSESGLDAAFEAVKGALATFDGRIGIYIQSERVDIETNLHNIELRKLELNDELRVMLLEEQKKHLSSMANKSRNVLNFYICLEKKADNYVSAEQLLRDSFNAMKTELEASEMYFEQLLEKDIYELLYERMNPESSNVEPFQDDWSINNILPENAVILKDGRHLQIENYFYRFYSLTKYPTTVDKYRWLRRIFQVNGNINIAITLTPKNKATINKELSDASKEAGRKANDDRLDAHLKMQYEEEKNSALTMIQELSGENINLYDTNITIAICSKDMNSLNTLGDKLRASIQSTFCQSTEIRRKGFDPFFTTLPILPNNKITQNFVWNLSTADIASILPFDSSEYMESSGILVAENDTSHGLTIVNPDNKIYNNSHMCIIADSGSGKTFFIYLLAIRSLPYSDYIIMFDIKGDLYFPWGKRYVFSPNSGIVSNPFHMRNAIIDSESDFDNGRNDVGNYLAQKIMDLIVFFKWVIPDMSPFDEALLEEDVRDAYADDEFGLTFESKELPKIFPTFTTLDSIMEKKIGNADSSLAKERRQYLKAVLRPFVSGAYSKMFNGQTNWDFDFHTIFDISNLPEAVQKPMYDILLKDTWQFCKKDGTLKPPKKLVFVDECHEFADPANPQTLKFISTKMIKQGRGFGVKLITATQNLPDLLSIPRFGQAIIDNSYFKLFMRLGETDLPVAQKLYNFSDSELKILKANTKMKSNKGKGIFLIGSQRVVIQTRASMFELEIVDPEQYEDIHGVPSRFKKGTTKLTEVI